VDDSASLEDILEVERETSEVKVPEVVISSVARLLLEARSSVLVSDAKEEVDKSEEMAELLEKEEEEVDPMLKSLEVPEVSLVEELVDVGRGVSVSAVEVVDKKASDDTDEDTEAVMIGVLEDVSTPGETDVEDMDSMVDELEEVNSVVESTSLLISLLVDAESLDVFVVEAVDPVVVGGSA